MFEAENDPYVASRKTVKEFNSPTVLWEEDTFYLVAGKKQIYLLKHCKLEESEFLGLFAKLFIT